VVSKARSPLLRPGTVRRSSLIARLAQGDRRPVISVVAPPGYGKTTLLAQWAEASGLAFAWVSAEEPDNDPKVLLAYVAEALNRVEPIDERVFEALASPGSSVPGSVVPRLGSAFWSMSAPVVLVVDDVHVLRNVECRAALSVLADHVPAGSRLARAGEVMVAWQGSEPTMMGLNFFRRAIELEHVAVGLCERSLVAMARGQWDRAAVLDERADVVVRRAGIEESYATPLVCAVRARTAMHRTDPPAVHQELARAQRLRHLLTYALPHFAVQARIELARVHLALADLAGARMLMREVDDLLRRRPGLGTLAGEAGTLRAQLASQPGASIPGVPALTAAELRLRPMLSTHLSFPEIAAEMVLSRHTIKTQANAIYRKLGTSSRSQAVARSRELGLLAG
jgi:ATP/maltotriose-dependent transcriptional regulator MalT